ncbi:kinesin light chain [Phlyctema vagabunda]|uniref:Kinesin light chain n=1 Tax=Phlyctema vagabunda TaxID=108571 RepID=A0ABR4PE77_9HELO
MTPSAAVNGQSVYHGTSASGNSRVHMGDHHGNIIYATPVAQKEQSFFQSLTRKEKCERLLKAAAEGQSRRLRLLIQAGADLDCKNEQGQTALHLASRCANEECVDLLIDNGADIHAVDKLGKQPIHEAVASGDDKVVQKLRAKGASQYETGGAYELRQSQSEFLNSEPEDFVGREMYLTDIQNTLSSSDSVHRIALIGLGGVGKTRIALQVAQSFKLKSSSVFWIHASSATRFEKSYLEILRQNNIPGYDEYQDTPTNLLLVRQWLEGPSSGHWLIVIDSADDLDLLYGQNRYADYFPRCEKGGILLTSRNEKVATNFIPAKDRSNRNIMEITSFDSDEASRFFATKFGPEKVERDSIHLLKLATELSNVPLALAQATDFMLANRMSAHDYLSLYNESDSSKMQLLSVDFEDAGRDPENKNPVATTYAITFDHLQKHHPLAADVLCRMCVLDPQGIPESLLKSQATSVDTIIAFGILQDFSLITRRTAQVLGIQPNERSFDMHRLIYLAMRSWLSKEAMLVSFTARAVVKMNTCLSKITWKHKTLWSIYLPHAIKLLSCDEYQYTKSLIVERYNSDFWYSNMSNETDNKPKHTRLAIRHENPNHTADHKICPVCCAALNYTVSEHLGIHGSYASALLYAQDSLKLRLCTLGKSHLDSILSMIQTIKCLLEGSGALVLQIAEKLGRTAMSESQKFGNRHPLYLESMLALAAVYRKQGHYEQARDLGQKALTAHIKIYSPEDPLTCTSMSSLATTKAHFHKYDEALDLINKVAQIRSRSLGSDHPQTLLSMTNLGTIYSKLGDHTTAASVQTKTLNLRRTVSGDVHPETLRCMANLAATYTQLAAYDKAETINKEVLDLRQKTLGEDHQDTLASMSSLGRIYMRQSRWPEAKKIYMSVVPKSYRVLGPSHADSVKRDAKLQECIAQCDQLQQSARNEQKAIVAVRMSKPIALIVLRSTVKGIYRCLTALFIPIVFYLDATYEGREGWGRTPDYYERHSDSSEWASTYEG